MVLRINPDNAIDSILGSLRRVQSNLLRNMERLATGLQINRAADSPSGLVISEQLRAQLAEIGQAIENTQRGVNLFRTADAGLAEMSDIMVGLRGLIVRAMNTGALTPEQRGVIQNQVTQAIGALERIATTTRFAGEPLLSGAQDFVLTNVPAQVQEATFYGAPAGTAPFNVHISVINPATQATAGIATGAIAGTTIRIQGPIGTAELRFEGGATQAEVIEAINAYRERTGVEATPAGEIRTMEYGAGIRFTIEEISGDLTGINPGVYRGTDIQATVQGQNVTGRGNVLEFSVADLTGRIVFRPGTPAGEYGFTIAAGGMTFQIGGGTEATGQVRIGIPDMTPGNLGFPGGIGSLNTLLPGGVNNVLTNPAGAMRVLDEAMRDVNAARANLGAIESQLFEPNIRALMVTEENIAATESAIRDLDFAEGIAALVRDQILGRANIYTMLQARISARDVLRLLA